MDAWRRDRKSDEMKKKEEDVMLVRGVIVRYADWGERRREGERHKREERRETDRHTERQTTRKKMKTKTKKE